MAGGKNLKICLIIAIVTLSIAPSVSADKIIYVDDDGPADFNNIQAAINDANDGDTIIVMPGLYEENVHFFCKA